MQHLQTPARFFQASASYFFGEELVAFPEADVRLPAASRKETLRRLAVALLGLSDRALTTPQRGLPDAPPGGPAPRGISQASLETIVTEPFSADHSGLRLSASMAGPPVSRAWVLRHDCRSPSGGVVGQVVVEEAILARTVIHGQGVQVGSRTAGVAQRAADHRDSLSRVQVAVW